MEKKNIRLLTELENHLSIKASDLALKLNVSEKTIRNSIKMIRFELEKNGAQILSSSKSGYELNITNPDLYRSFIKKETSQNEDEFESSEQRILYILRYFLYHSNDYVKLDDLAEMMHVSKSCINRDIKEVKRLLSEHNLSFESKPAYGSKIKGKEFDLRICIAEYTVHNEDANQNYLDKYDSVFTNIIDCLNVTLDECNYKISDFSYQNLVMHLFVAILRIRQGNPVYLEEEQFNEIKEMDEFKIAVKLIDKLKTSLDLEVPLEEAGYVTIHLAAKREVHKSDEIPKNIIIDDKIHHLVEDILEHIYDRYSLDVRNDIDLVMALSMHFITLDVRLRYELNLYNPILKDIKNRYQLAFLITQSCNEIIMERYHKMLSDDELAYIALHIELAIERLKFGKEKKNVLIICSTGAGTSQLLKYEYQKKFKDYIDKIYVSEPNKLKEFDFNKVDYIFSTINIQLPVNKPVLLIHPILETKDIETISKAINNKFEVKKFFDERLFFDEIEGNSVEEVLKNMTNKIREVKEVPENFFDLIMEREKLGITNFQTGAAFPHPNLPCVEHTFIAVGILKKAIVWETSKVQMVYLFALTRNEKEHEIPLLYRVSGELLTDINAIKDIIDNKTFACLSKYLQEIEIRLGE